MCSPFPVSKLNSDLNNLPSYSPLLFNYASMTNGSPSSTNLDSSTKRTFTFNTYFTGLSQENYFKTQAVVTPTIIDNNHIEWTPTEVEGFGNLLLVIKLIPGGIYKFITSKNNTGIQYISLSFYKVDGTYIKKIPLSLYEELSIPQNAYYTVLSIVMKNVTVGTTYTVKGSVLAYRN